MVRKIHAKGGGRTIMDITWTNNFGPNGYGICGRGYAKILRDLGYNIKLYPYPYMDPKDELFPLTKTKVENPLDVYHAIPTTLKDAFYTVTEVRSPPDFMAYPLSKTKLVLTQSTFCKKSFSKVTDEKKIHVVNFPFFRGQFSPTGPKYKLHLDKEYKFKFFSVARIDIRKNVPALMKAFAEKFGDNPDVCLVLKLGSDRYCIPKMFYDLKLPRNIYWMTDYVEDTAMLYRAFDSYVTTDCGEGWGAPTTEAMLSGLPTIAPKHSGHLDYMRDDNSFLIDVDDWSYIGFRKDNLYPDLLGAQLEWKMPKHESIVDKMWDCYQKFKDRTKDDIAQDPMIKSALEVQKVVSKEYVGAQLKQALDWYESEYNGKT